MWMKLLAAILQTTDMLYLIDYVGEYAIICNAYQRYAQDILQRNTLYWYMYGMD